MDDAPRDPGRHAGPALFAVAAASCVFFAAELIRRPVEDLAGFVSDDAFYYLQTARNLAATGRPTFDGIHATNGYHPGWMAITTLLAKLFPDRESLLRAALSTSFALHLVTAWLVVRLCRRFVSRSWAFVLGALWAINPLPVTLAMQGVEAPLQLAALVLAVDAFANARGTGFATRGLVRLGAALGLLFWTRTDATVFAAVTVVLVGLHTGLRSAARAAAVTGGVFLLCTLPWFAWSYATVGSLVQDSGAIKMLWEDAAGGAHRRILGADDAVRFAAGRWLATPASLLTAAPALVGPVAGILFFAFVLGSMFRARRRGEAHALVAVSVLLLASTAALGLVYGGFFVDRMVWYFALPGLALFLVGTLWAADALRRIAALQRPVVHAAAAAALVVGAIFLFSRYQRRMPFEYPWQRDVLASQREFERSVPLGARIGCFNAGIPAYFGNRTVVNLDGLVNHDLVDVYRRGDLDRWLVVAEIAFIADEPLALGRAQKLTREPIRLTPVASAPLRGWMSPTRFLWRVEPR